MDRAEIRDFCADDDAKLKDPVHVAFQGGEEHTNEGLSVGTYRQNLESKAHSKVPNWTGPHYASELHVTVPDKVDRSMLMSIYHAWKQVCQVTSRTFAVHEDAV